MNLDDQLRSLVQENEQYRVEWSMLKDAIDRLDVVLDGICESDIPPALWQEIQHIRECVLLGGVSGYEI